MGDSCQICCRAIALLLVLGAVLWFPGCRQQVDCRSAPEGRGLSAEPLKLSDEVKRVLEQKTLLVENLAAQDRIVSAVRQACKENESLTDGDVRERDALWRSADGIDEFIKPFLTNDCADALIEFQEEHDTFSELLVTDSRGLLVAASNKSSDFAQADETWWIATNDDGRGRSYTGTIEYDDSARSESISVCVPIFAPETGQPIGVIKAVCDVTAIKLEL